eukprot:9023546-Ditylum_brightwellii.AAC.1
MVDKTEYVQVRDAEEKAPSLKQKDEPESVAVQPAATTTILQWWQPALLDGATRAEAPCPNHGVLAFKLSS